MVSSVAGKRSCERIQGNVRSAITELLCVAIMEKKRRGINSIGGVRVGNLREGFMEEVTFELNSQGSVVFSQMRRLLTQT